MTPTGLDELDARILVAVGRAPRASIMELARTLQVARGTVQTRLDRLQQRGVVTGFGPDLHLATLGYDVTAFVQLEIAQGRLEDVVAHLHNIAEVTEVHSTSGPGDLHCRLVARTNEHLQSVLNTVLEVSGIVRTSTQIALTEQIRLRTLPLVEQLIDDDPP
ncbi:Lrp/AsnC family transcriptional regulator [soil metagenome]